MKLASRISSIRRIAWKQWRSCSADSLSTWRDSLARWALAGWMRSPRASSTSVTGCCASQSISRSGCSRRSSSAIAASRWACPRPIGDEMYSARLRRGHRPRVQRRGGGGGADELAQQQVDLDGVAHVRAVAGALEQHEVAAGRLGERDPAARAGDRVVGALDHEHRAADARAQRRGPRPRPSSSISSAATSVSGVVSRPQPTQSSIGFVECGSVNIWREEELEEAAVVPQPVVAVVLRPALVGVEPLVPRVEPARGRLAERHRRGR